MHVILSIGLDEVLVVGERSFVRCEMSIANYLAPVQDQVSVLKNKTVHCTLQ
jgi:hypothetical protein